MLKSASSSICSSLEDRLKSLKRLEPFLLEEVVEVLEEVA